MASERLATIRIDPKSCESIRNLNISTKFIRSVTKIRAIPKSPTEVGVSTYSYEDLRLLNIWRNYEYYSIAKISFMGGPLLFSL